MPDASRRILGAAASRRSPRSVRPNGLVTLLTDFGTRDVFVGIMKGVLMGVNPRARVVDLTHEVAPQDVRAGALLLRSAVRYFPRGTVHLAVIDPGVGSARRALVLACRDAILVGPDNGLLAPAAHALGVVRAYAIDVERLVATKILRAPVSQTFHGRDVFAAVAAHLSKGLSPRALGPAVEATVALDLPVCRSNAREIEGEVLYVDRFGNLITNIAAEDMTRFSVTPVSVSIGDMSIHGLVPAYAAVPEGALLAIIGSWDYLEIAVRGGSAAQRLATGCGSSVRVTAA